jgi:predicted metal-dependent peptidase
MDAEINLGAAVLIVQRKYPYLAAALWAVRRVRAPGLGTMAVDAGWRLFYDPATLERWDVDELSGVVYHELCHLLREHAGRGGFADRKDLWNLAADAEINDNLDGEDVALPHGAIYPSSFGAPDDRLAEEYYRRLLEHVAPISAAGPAAGACGGAATGEMMDGLEGVESAARDGAPGRAWRVPPPIGDGEQEVIRRRVARDVDEHRRSAGSVPGHLGRWANERLEPRVDWRRELAALVRWGLAQTAGLVDYTYARPSRRQACAGRVVLPSLRSPVPRVAAIVDTSGSMTEAMLSVALGEIRGILTAAGLREGLAVLSVDAAVHERQRVVRAESVRLTGGGGTDMGIGLAAAERLSPRPEIVVVVTDGYTPWPECAPRGIRTIVVKTDSRGTSPSWARTVVVPPDALMNQSAGRA